MVKRSIGSGEIIIDPLDPAYQEDKLALIEPLIDLVTSYSATDAIKRFSMLNQNACSGTRQGSESVKTSIEHYLLPAQV